MRKIIRMALICMVSTTSCTPNYAERYKDMKSSIASHANCNEQWDKLWPMAKSGDFVARELLADLMITQGLRIPGEALDDDRHIYWYLTMGLHENINKLSEPNTYDYLVLISSELNKHPRRSINTQFSINEAKKHQYLQVLSCFTTRFSFFGNASKGCVEMAADYGLIMPFDAFVQLIDKQLQAGKKATCIKQ